MVKIRLARGGAKKRPFYHVVVTDMRNRRDGRYIERVGFFNPVAVGGDVPLRLDVERIQHWQAQGAQTSERVLNLVKHFQKHGEQAAPPRAEPPKSKAKAKPAAPEDEAKTAEAAKPEAEEAKPEEPKKAEEQPEAKAEADSAPATEEKEEAKAQEESASEAEPKSESEPEKGEDEDTKNS